MERYTMSNTLLQVALDLISIEDALRIASTARVNNADIIEAGTLLIKAYGMQAIRSLKQICPDTPILADMKILDNGMKEVELAVTSGADIVTVSALASDKTILDAVLTADKYGAKVMVDFMYVTNPLDRALMLCERGIDYICIHASPPSSSSSAIVTTNITEEKYYDIGDSIKVVKSLSSSCNIPIAVECILDEESYICDFVRAGASIIVVGSSIIKADDVASKVRWLKRLLQCT
jgi:3-hexulose-6-phosphate synthase/6-phospho-3-hexuloisomerase